MNQGRNKQSKRTTSPNISSLTSLVSGLSMGQAFVLIAAACLIGVGIVMVYSASSIEAVSNGQAVFTEAFKQIFFVFVGLFAFVASFFVIKKFTLTAFIWFFYWFCIALVVLTAACGTSQYGASRWLSFGGVTVQGSEFAKIAFVLVTAYFIDRYKQGTFHETLSIRIIAKIARFNDEYSYSKRLTPLSLCIIAYVFFPLAILVATQSDLGTTMICSVGVYALLWASGLYRKSYLILVLVVIFVAGLALIVSSPYRFARLTNFVNPWADPDGDGYQHIHSLKALASGGLFGVGLGGSYQKLLYLPMASTDFIFAIIGEELGLVGAVIVIVLFMMLLFGGLKIASESQLDFCSLVAGGLTIMIVFQAFLNIYCVIDFAPITGKPLPFISSGGSSMVSSVVTVGFILMMGFMGGNNEDIHQQRRNNLSVVSEADPREGGHRQSQSVSGTKPGGRYSSASNSAAHNSPRLNSSRNYSNRNTRRH